MECRLPQIRIAITRLVHGATITESLVRRHFGCSYANKNVFSDRRNSPSSVSGRRSFGGKCSRSGGRQRGNSGRQNGYGSSGRCMCPNADSGENCQRKPSCNSQQGKTAPSRATTYKVARVAYSRHDAEPAANGGRARFTTRLTRLQPKAPDFRGPPKGLIQPATCHIVHCDSPKISVI